MAKKTVNEVIKDVLIQSGKPLTIIEIYNTIVKNNLYSFNSANPQNIVRTQLRRHSENLNFPKASQQKYFVYNDNGTYSIKK